MYLQGCEIPLIVSARSYSVSRPRFVSFIGFQSGTSLIEVLVTLVLIAIGLSGMMVMQARGIQQNQSAYLRTQAVALATDMADRIRLNHAAALSDHYQLNISQAVDDFSSTGLSGGKKLAYEDLSDWLLRVNELLPEGDASITRTDQCLTVSIQWQGRRDDGVLSGYQHEVEL